MAKFKVNLSIGYANANQEDIIEIDDEFLEGKTDKEKDEYLNYMTREWAFNYIDWSYEPYDEDEEED